MFGQIILRDPVELGQETAYLVGNFTFHLKGEGVAGAYTILCTNSELTCFSRRLHEIDLGSDDLRKSIKGIVTARILLEEKF